MKTKSIVQVATVLLLSTLNLQLSTCFAQGSLTPPSAPAPTMKSLDQIEARTPISSAPYTITNPGSYYLMANINVSSGNAITIATNGVTLDLNGFTISSTEVSPAGNGIQLGNGVTDIIIRNGHIKGRVTYSGGVYSGSGFANGIEESGSPPFNVRVTGVAVSGCLNDGIAVGPNSTVVESCTVRTVGGYGIEADSVMHSTAELCGSDAINASTVADSVGTCTGGADGVDASFTANNCSGFSSNGTGLNAVTAHNCYGVSITGDGIDADVVNGSEGANLGGGTGNGISANTAHNCDGTSAGSGNGVGVAYTAENCYGNSSSGTGVNATTALNCYGSSTSGDGVSAGNGIAQNCYGYSSGSGVGLSARYAENCYGESNSGTGVLAFIAQNCSGVSNFGGIGLYAEESAIGCYGAAPPNVGIQARIAAFCTGDSFGGTAIRATIANGCIDAAGTNNITYKYNMP